MIFLQIMYNFKKSLNSLIKKSKLCYQGLKHILLSNDVTSKIVIMYVGYIVTPPQNKVCVLIYTIRYNLYNLSISFIYSTYSNQFLLHLYISNIFYTLFLSKYFFLVAAVNDKIYSDLIA